MPFYEVFCMLSKSLDREAVAQRLLNAGRVVLASQGVIMDIRSYGVNTIGHVIRKNAQGHKEVAIIVGGSVKFAAFTRTRCTDLLKPAAATQPPSSSQALSWGMDVNVGPKGLADLEKSLRFDNEVLRWRIFKRPNVRFDPKAIKMRHLVQEGGLHEALTLAANNNTNQPKTT